MLLLLSLREMKFVLPLIVGREGGKRRWVQSLLSFKPVVVEGITRAWEEEGEGKGGREEEGGIADFFAVIFPEDYEERIQKHLFEGKEMFAREACENLVGCQEEGPLRHQVFRTGLMYEFV